MTDSWSAAGCFRDMSNMGFSDLDSIRETGIENQVDAKATEIQIHLQTSPPKIIFADNASGMNKEQLAASRRLFNRKEAHDEKNGCFGIGGSVGSSQLTRLSGEATRLSKLQGKPVQQLTLDYPTILKEDKYNLHVHGATKEMSDLWEKYAVDKQHGTLDILDCPASVVKDMIDTLPSARLGRMYADYLTTGTKITLHIDGKVSTIMPEDVSDEKNAHKVEKYSVNVWQNPSTLDVIAQYTNGNNQLVFMEDGNEKKKKNKEDPAKMGYEKKGTINCVSSIRFKRVLINGTYKTEESSWKLEDGGQYFKRMKKIIERFVIPYPKSGDFPERDIIAASRHVWQFSTGLDKLMGIEINKSRMNKSNIHPTIYTTLDTLAEKFSKDYWKDLKKSEKVNSSTPTVAKPAPTVAKPTPTPISKPAIKLGSLPLVTNTLIPVTTTVTATTPDPTTPSVVKSKSSVIDVPAHQKLVPQSPKDLVTNVKNLKAELDSLDLDAILSKASNVTEGGIASKIQTLQDIRNFLQGFRS